MTNEEKLQWAGIGWLALLGVKYIVFGLDQWNAIFHPGLVIAPNQEAFRKPFLGAL